MLYSSKVQLSCQPVAIVTMIPALPQLLAPQTGRYALSARAAREGISRSLLMALPDVLGTARAAVLIVCV